VPTSHQKLSPGEFEVLKILWKLDSATVAEVRDAHNSKGRPLPAYTTTMTMLGRLVEKEAVRVDRERQPFRYRPAMRRSTLLRHRLREFVETSYEGDTELLMEDLLGEGHLETETARRVLGDTKGSS
jgi:BlaI family penicillinase repressor